MWAAREAMSPMLRPRPPWRKTVTIEETSLIVIVALHVTFSILTVVLGA